MQLRIGLGGGRPCVRMAASGPPLLLLGFSIRGTVRDYARARSGSTRMVASPCARRQRALGILDTIFLASCLADRWPITLCIIMI